LFRMTCRIDSQLPESRFPFKALSFSCVYFFG